MSHVVPITLSSPFLRGLAACTYKSLAMTCSHSFALSCIALLSACSFPSASVHVYSSCEVLRNSSIEAAICRNSLCEYACNFGFIVLNPFFKYVIGWSFSCCCYLVYLVAHAFAVHALQCFAVEPLLAAALHIAAFALGVYVDAHPASCYILAANKVPSIYLRPVLTLAACYTRHHAFAVRVAKSHKPAEASIQPARQYCPLAALAPRLSFRFAASVAAWLLHPLCHWDKV